MSEIRLSNTLVNDTRQALLAYVQQLKDTTIDWNSSDFSQVPNAFKTEPNKFQDKLNAFFFAHHKEFQEFLKTESQGDNIITWEDLEQFLAGVTKDKTLLEIIEEAGTGDASFVQIRDGVVVAADENGVVDISVALSGMTSSDEWQASKAYARGDICYTDHYPGSKRTCWRATRDIAAYETLEFNPGPWEALTYKSLAEPLAVSTSEIESFT